MNSKPGIGGKPFYLKFDSDYFNKKDILVCYNVKCEVVKVYRLTWWRKILRKLGFRVRIFEVKVKPLNNA